MQRKPIDYKEILSMFLPARILDYFEFTDYSNMGKYDVFSLHEKSEIPTELKSLPLVSKGFYPEITITDFPVRDHTVYFKIKRKAMGGQKRQVVLIAVIGNKLQTELI